MAEPAPWTRASQGHLCSEVCDCPSPLTTQDGRHCDGMIKIADSQIRPFPVSSPETEKLEKPGQ